MITLYKGDDTGGQLGKNVKIVFHCDDAVDMDDVVVKFDLLGIVKREFTDVHDGDILDIFISHAESRKFPLGVIFAKMWGEDASGKLRTFANRIPFRVTLNLIAVYGSDGTDSQDIHVYSSVDWDSIANKPTVFPSSVEEVEGLQEVLDEINGKIPEDASADNQLADKEWVDQEIDRVAAYYITSDAQGNPFQTRAALLNAETYYSGGSPRTPTRNDYAIVLADESHGGAEWRYIYAVADGSTTGQWEAQYPIETNDYDALANKPSINGLTLSGNKTAAALGLATKADATLTERFSAWTFSPATIVDHGVVRTLYMGIDPATGKGFPAFDDAEYGQIHYGENRDLAETTEQIWHGGTSETPNAEDITATRTALPGYILGSQTNRPLASEAEAEALRQSKQNALTAQQLANIAAVPSKANDADVLHNTLGWLVTNASCVGMQDPTGKEASFRYVEGLGTFLMLNDMTYYAPSSGGTLALTANIPYTLTTKTISNGAVTLDDRAVNAVTISTTLSPNTLTINFTTAPTGKVRDFGLRLSVASGITTAPELVLPQGVTCENADGEVPEIGADGAATILYFTETASGVFLVKGEVVQTIS